MNTVPREIAEKLVICQYCGGYHVYVCPRIIRIAYDHVPDDTNRPVEVVSAIEFDPKITHELFKDVLWPE